MPAINVRFSDEQHEILREAAFAARRSLQKEILARLFGGLGDGERTAASGQTARAGTGPSPSPSPPPGADIAASRLPATGKRTYQPDLKGEK